MHPLTRQVSAEHQQMMHAPQTAIVFLVAAQDKYVNPPLQNLLSAPVNTKSATTQRPTVFPVAVTSKNAPGDKHISSKSL